MSDKNKIVIENINKEIAKIDKKKNVDWIVSASSFKL